MKTLKITVIALLSLTLATVSCKKEAAPTPAPAAQGSGSGSQGGSVDDSTGTTDSIISFTDLVDNISVDSTIVYDSTVAMSNRIDFLNMPFDQSGITIFTASNGGMTNAELNSAGVYSDRLSAIEIYNEASSAWEVYTLDSSAAKSLSIYTSNGYAVVLKGTFTNASGVTVVVPELIIK